MTLFIVVAVIMVLSAIAVVAVPLLRGERDGRSALAAAIAIALVSAVGYTRVSNWNWQNVAVAPAAAAAGKDSDTEVAAGVTKLEQYLSTAPGDIQAWLMLGKAHLVLGAPDSAVKAFTQANRLSNGKNVAAALGLGESLALRAGGHIDVEADRQFESAIALAPQDPQALLLSGLAAAQRGDASLARRRWQKLKRMHPAPNLAAMLDARIAALD